MQRRFPVFGIAESDYEYLERSSILEESKLSIDYLKRIERWLRKILDSESLDRARPENSITDEKTSPYRSLDTIEFRDLLLSVSRAARTVSERYLIDKPDQSLRVKLNEPLGVGYAPAKPIYVLDKPLAFYGGILERFRPHRIMDAFDDYIVFAFLGISGFDDVLDRDRHGDSVGWHYNYCKSDGLRSDTILTFDRNGHEDPLFWERHRERNAHFAARASAWGKDKRKSAYDACAADLFRAPETFRLPSDEAQAVWPQNAILSKIPPSAVPAKVPDSTALPRRRHHKGR